MRTQLRLLWRMHRWEGAFFIGGALLLSVAMAIVAWQLDASRDVIVACHEQPAETLSAACRSAIEWGNTLTGSIGILGALATVAPFAAGTFLGAPMLSREIEHGTAPLAWSLSPSRPAWLAWRTVPVIVLLLAALLVLGQASALLLGIARERDLGFQEYGMFGPILAARGLAVFALGLLVGLVLGRVLPALLVTVLATVAIAGGLSIGRDLLMREEAIWVPMGDQADFVHMVFDQGFRFEATGEVIGWDAAYTAYPEAFDPMTGEGVVPGTTPVWKIVPPESFGLYVARESAALGLVAVVAAASSIWAVVRRRPG